MTARLFSKTGETRGLELALETGREIVVGRDPSSDLPIERPLMSGRHARIFYDDDARRFVLEDLGSLNGTELDGDRVSGSEQLGHLNVITFAGSYDFFFIDTERCARRHPEVSAETRRPPIADTPAKVDAPAAADTDEVTSVDREPIAMPGFLARRADALRDSAEHDPAEAATPSEVTSIEREPVALPGFLARRAEDAAAGETPAKDAGGEAAKPGQTVHEKLPVALPGSLARRSEEAAEGAPQGDVQKHETVDLWQIEKLIAAEEAAVRGASEASEVGLQLIVTEAGGSVRRFPLVPGENPVGRGADAMVVLKYPDLSRRHAVITVTGETITVRDLGSRNRTFADDSALEPQVDVEVHPGARLRFGSVEARLRKVGDPHNGGKR